jgi:hypothetical protein
MNRRRFTIRDESSRLRPLFVVKEFALTGPILGYQWHSLASFKTRGEAEEYLRSMENEDR